MALTRTLTQLLTTATINDSANQDASAELDIGDATIAEQCWLYVSISGWAAAPSGTVSVRLYPRHTTGTNNFDDHPLEWVWPVTADVAYRFAVPLTTLPRYSMLNFANDSGQNTAAGAVDIWLERISVT